jgi:hypothetical protein
MRFFMMEIFKTLHNTKIKLNPNWDWTGKCGWKRFNYIRLGLVREYSINASYQDSARRMRRLTFHSVWRHSRLIYNWPAKTNDATNLRWTFPFYKGLRDILHITMKHTTSVFNNFFHHSLLEVSILNFFCVKCQGSVFNKFFFITPYWKYLF